jgi:arylsulfatase A-like enzyme
MKQLTVLLSALGLLHSAFAASPPNIIYIMSDDHTAHAIGAYGGRLAKLNPTPTLDRLAKEGMLFGNCFVTNSICTPSRACVLTGQYNHVNKVYDLGGKLEPARQTLPIEMKKAGYQTAMIGKWHLAEEPAAFDYYCVLPGQGKYFDPDFNVRGEQPWPKNTIQRDGQHATDAITDLALDWMKTKRDPKQPFFLMYHHKAPHDMFEYAPRYEDYLKDVEIPEPESLWKQPDFGSLATRGYREELLPYIGTSVGDRNLRRNYVKEWNHGGLATEELRKRTAYNDYLKRYLRCVKGVDDSLAIFFDYLRSAGLMDNTIIVYTSDQGMMLGEHDYQDKRWMYEESQRMPFIIRYPKAIKAGTRTDAIVENVDFAPTLLDFAGVKAPAAMQGRSFKAICEAGVEPPDWKKAAYYRYWMHLAHHDNPGHLGIRTKEFKLIYYYGMGRDDKSPRTPPAWELYDLKKDPQELVNVYDKPDYAQTVVDLKKQLAERRKAIGDDGSDYPEIEAVVQEFWNYDADTRIKAEQISRDFRALKEAEAAAPPAAKGKGKKK